MEINWRLRPASPEDVNAIAELRAVVMRPDLERLGRYDPVRVRRRFLDAYVPDHTFIIEADGEFAGSVALRPDGDEWWLEHFYLDPALHGRGLGTLVLRTVLDRVDGDVVRLNVLQGSSARRLYERFEFEVERQDEVDMWMVRTG